MSETKHTTNLEIRASTQGIKDVGKELRGAFDPKMMASFAATIDKVSAAMEGLAAHQERLVDLQKQSAREGAAGAAAIVQAINGRSAGDKEAREEKARKQAEATAARQAAREQKNADRAATSRQRTMMAGGALGLYGLNRMAGGASNVAGSAASGSLGMALASMLPFGMGSAASGVIGAMRGYTSQAEGYGSALAGNFGQTGIGDVSGLAGNFAAHGLSMSDAPGVLAGFGGSTGLRGSQLASVAPELLDMQRGMGLGSAGNIIRANATGGGSENPERGLGAIRDAIAAGMMSGISEGRLDEYLAEIAQNVEAARSEGVSLTSESLTTLVAGFGAMGLRGQSATHAATTAASSMRNLGEDTSFASQVALRIAMAGDERTGGTGPRGYEEALAFMESNPDVMTRAQMGEIRNLSGGSRGVLAGNIRRGMPGLSRSEAWTLSEGNGGAFAPMSDFERSEASSIVEERAGQARRSSGLAAGRADLTNSGISLGSGIGQESHALERSEMRWAQELNPMVAGAIQSLSDTLRESLNTYNAAGGGMEGIKAIMTEMMGGLVDAFRNAFPNVSERIDETVDVLANPGDWGNQLRDGMIMALTAYFGPSFGDMIESKIRRIFSPFLIGGGR
jgi:hypothetical protein